MNEKTNVTYNGRIDLGFCGKYCVQVIDANTNKIVSDYGWHKNLILNSGLDGVATHLIGNLSLYAIAGTGSRPNYITSSTSTITQSANYIGLADFTGIASFSQSLDTDGTRSYNTLTKPGDLIIDQDMSQSLVTAVSLDGTTLTISGSGFTYTTPKTFTIWKTSQTGLQGESQRTANFLTGQSGSVWNCGTILSSNVMTMRRTYNFTAEVQSQSYAEVGCSWDGNAQGSVFSRMLLPQTVSLAPAQQLRLIYDLVATFNPTTQSYKTIAIGGWPVAPSTSMSGTESIVQSFTPSSVNSNGNQDGGGQFSMTSMDPASTNFYIFASDSSAPFYTGSLIYGAGIYRPGDYTLVGGSLGSYVPGTYTNTKSGTLTIYQGISSNIRTIGCAGGVFQVGVYSFVLPNDQNGQMMLFTFDQPQSKTNLQTLTLSWRWSWGRTIQ